MSLLTAHKTQNNSISDSFIINAYALLYKNLILQDRNPASLF